MARKPKSKVNSKLRHSVKVGNKWFRLRTNELFFPELASAEIRATKPQMRHLAMGSATLLVTKILAGDPQGHPTVIKIADLSNVPKGYVPTRDRKPFQHFPLEETYVEEKVWKEQDPRPLIATGFYIDHIEVTEKESNTGTLWVVNVPDIMHEPSGVPLPTLVGWLEYGNAKIHARPHWRPTAVVVKNKWKRLPKSIRVDALKEALRKMR